jgi:type II secretory pathway pseudopilin PulG
VSRDGEAGFLLVETIVAFLVLSIALAIGVQSVAQGTASVRRADAAAVAAMVAREIVATRAGGLAAPGEWSGQHPSGAAWRLTAARVPDERALPLYLVSVAVRPAGSSRAYDYRSFAVGEPPE